MNEQFQAAAFLGCLVAYMLSGSWWVTGGVGLVYLLIALFRPKRLPVDNRVERS